MPVFTCSRRDATSTGPLPRSSSESSRGQCTAPEHALAFAPGGPTKVTVRFPTSSTCSCATDVLNACQAQSSILMLQC